MKLYLFGGAEIEQNQTQLPRGEMVHDIAKYG